MSETNKNRLERLESIAVDESGKPLGLKGNDYEWLVQQARRGNLMEQYRWESELHLDLSQSTERVIEKLQKALAFYAEGERYVTGMCELMGELPSEVQMDGGDKARRVMGELK